MPRRRASARQDPNDSDAEVEPQSQRRRISAAEPRSQERRGSAAEVDEAYGDDLDGETQDDTGNQEQLVKNFVRLALACEYTRSPLKRNDITTRVMGTHNRQFKAVFAQAQQQLRHVFGMEMTELPAREKITMQQKRAAAKSQYQKEVGKSQAKSQRGGGSNSQPKESSQQASNAWILTTVLPENLRTPEILPPPMVPTTEAESIYTALSTIIVSAIMLSGGTLLESKLERHLTRLNIDELTPFSNSITMNTLDKREKLLKKMEKDGFIVKVRDTSSGEEVVEYVVGSRGKVEIGQEGAKGIVRAVYGEVDDPEDLEGRLKRSLRYLQSRTQADLDVAA
ncbi:MAGE-domain-containing protein [Myriangium duriaei CBS 260.36]|uniref:MAGE-domain-containing protein n=1 Tax=Myriangium duriaei CBS 260.36 TaxID=1168546 RepID=A0A9P4IY20_9PEZI|nr:MAGE-domain-containing protein [Myriangium duriaei CBS 260.36]